MATGGAAHPDWPRRAAAAALAATFIVLAPVAVASAWIRGTVLSTSGYVAAVSDVAASPAVRTVIREAVTAEVSAMLPRADGALALLLALTMLGWLQSGLIARTDPRYQPVASALVHALTSGFFTLTTWCEAGGLTVIAVTLLSGPYRWAAAVRRYVPFTAVWRED
jgi:hypothetical protein